MEYVEFKRKKYKIIEENLGNGSFGITKLLKDDEIDEFFVCKKYEPQPNLDKIFFYDNFKKEIKIMYKINHPNVARVFDYYLYGSSYSGYIIMEYIDGINIKEWFELYDSNNVSINNIFRQLIEGFSCIEENGIAHRDIRESNILVSNDETVKIIDFGLGKYIDDYNISLDSFNEIINRSNMEKIPNEFSQKKYTSKTDMFCIAELFERMLKNYNIKDFEYNHILQKMLQINPNDRYASFNDILKELDKNEFKKLEISDEDKCIYNDFVQSLYDCIGIY